MLIGVDCHPSFQTIAFLVQETGEYGEQELNHSDGKAERFYRDLKQRGICVRVGMEASGYARWFERLLAELGFELWIGDVDARKSLSENLGTESGESGSAATAVASPSVSADAYQDHESTSSVGHERRPTLEEKAVE